MKTTIDKDKPVLVTGATSYIAGWLIKQLLAEGITVHACVRDPSNNDKIKHLEKLERKSGAQIKYFKSDLLEEGSYDEAIEGCAVVFHVASPFVLSVEDPQRDLADPAKIGTRNVLESANKAESVQRVVLTSSYVAMFGDNADLVSLPNGTVDEDCWNTTSTLHHQPYPYSKVIAEKEAMRIHQEQNRWDLVVINPSLVLGPSLNESATSESFNIMRQMGNGDLGMGVPNLGIGVVDVRDVAEAHYRAAYTPTASGRYLVSGHDTSMMSIGQQLLPEYKSYPIPPRILPKALVWLVGPIQNKSLTRKYVCQNVNYDFKGNATKSIKDLGLQYRPLKQSVTEMFQQLIDTKQI